MNLILLGFTGFLLGFTGLQVAAEAHRRGSANNNAIKCMRRTHRMVGFHIQPRCPPTENNGRPLKNNWNSTAIATAKQKNNDEKNILEKQMGSFCFVFF